MRLAFVTALALCAVSGSAQAQDAVRFTTIDIYLDSGSEPVAAYQVEVVAKGSAQIVGVEGGAHAAFAQPPYYDPRALATGRIVLGALSTAVDLPSGRHRFATLHMRESGAAVSYAVRVQAAANAAAHKIVIQAEARPRELN